MWTKFEFKLNLIDEIFNLQAIASSFCQVPYTQDFIKDIMTLNPQEFEMNES